MAGVWVVDAGVRNNWGGVLPGVEDVTLPVLEGSWALGMLDDSMGMTCSGPVVSASEEFGPPLSLCTMAGRLGAMVGDSLVNVSRSGCGVVAVPRTEEEGSLSAVSIKSDDCRKLGGFLHMRGAGRRSSPVPSWNTCLGAWISADPVQGTSLGGHRCGKKAQGGRKK